MDGKIIIKTLINYISAIYKKITDVFFPLNNNSILLHVMKKCFGHMSWLFSMHEQLSKKQITGMYNCYHCKTKKTGCN